MDARDDRGNPMNLMEKLLQTRIFRNAYWKEHCFGLTEETLAERAMQLEYIGGTYGGNKAPTPFICLVLAMLHMAPEREIILEFIKNEDYKYVRALGAFYLRLTGSAVDVYQYLEPLLMDLRKLRKRTDTGFIHVYMDSFIEELLSPDNYSCDITLPFIAKRITLEENGELKPRCSPLDGSKELEEKLATITGKNADSDDDSDELEANFKERMKRERWRDKKLRKSSSRSRSPSRSPESRRRRDSRHYDRDRRRHRSRSRDRRRYERSSSRERSYRRRSRSRSPYRRHRDRSSSRDRRRRRYSRSRSPRDRRDRYDRRERGEGRDSRRDRRSPPRKKQHKADNNTKPSTKGEKQKSKNGEISMSVEETNKMRASLGLPPLK